MHQPSYSVNKVNLNQSIIICYTYLNCKNCSFCRKSRNLDLLLFQFDVDTFLILAKYFEVVLYNMMEKVRYGTITTTFTSIITMSQTP